MDVIDKAVKNGLNISRITRFNGQTWQSYEEAVKGKKVFLFGVGPCAKIFFEHYKGKDINLEGVIDNNSEKWGLRVEDVVYEAFRSGKGGLRISGMDALDSYAADELVVLVSSTKYYEEMVSQLEELGVRNCFILLIMEANRRQEDVGREQKPRDFLSRRKEYLEECGKEEIEDKKIVFYSFGSYSDHGKYISEKLKRIRDDLDIVWLMNDTSAEQVEGVRFVSVLNWRKYIYEMRTAKIWVFNVDVPDYIEKREGQIYVQVKHWAGVTLKRCYLDSATISEAPSYNNWKRNGRMMDYMITGSEFDTEFCRRAFAFEKEIVQIGSPRSDAVFHEKANREKICECYRIDTEKKILMYAPTFRFQEGSCYEQKAPRMELDFAMLKSVLEERWGGKWCILLRLHPIVARESKTMKFPEYVTDVSGYSDSQELVAASDVVISDYSSIMFEPAFVKKPVFLFAPDRESYIDKEYDLLMDYDSLPFQIAESNEELRQNILTFREKDYEERLNKFLEKYGVSEDGHASERAAQFIAGLI